jgi:hypothetical protein
MRRIFCILGAVMVTAGVAGASTVTSGLRGMVVASAGGACLQDDDCGRNAAADTMLVFSASGRATERTMTHGDGTYRIRLSPGTYRVRAMGSGLQARVMPSVMSVQQGRMKRVDFVIVAPHIP